MLHNVQEHQCCQVEQNCTTNCKESDACLTDGFISIDIERGERKLPGTSDSQATAAKQESKDVYA